MKRLVPRLIGFFLLIFISAPAADGLSHARRAQALLGADVWSQIVQIENSSRSRRYPEKVHALIFELADALWFYSDVDGTQSLSTYRGRTAQDKTDFGPLLREIDAGFSRWRLISSDESANARARGEGGPLLNGCFIESIAALRTLVAHGEALLRPRLLSYYVKNLKDVQGHTVLTYETKAGVTVIDPLEAGHARTFPLSLAHSASALASELLGMGVTKAMWLVVDDFTPSDASRYSTVAKIPRNSRPNRSES